MKKWVSACLAVSMCLGMSVTAFAAPGAFVSSPSGNQAPVLEGFEVESEECEAELIITSYAERDTLEMEAEEKMELAYAQIVGTNDLTTLSEALRALAERLGIDSRNLAVSDLFDISCYNCEYDFHQDEEHGEFSIRVRSEHLGNFVGLLHFYEGSWELVENATAAGDILSFRVDRFSPFAIVVEREAAVGETPKTGDTSNVYSWMAVVAASGLGVLVCVKKSKKQKEY